MSNATGLRVALIAVFVLAPASAGAGRLGKVTKSVARTVGSNSSGSSGSRGRSGSNSRGADRNTPSAVVAPPPANLSAAVAAAGIGVCGHCVYDQRRRRPEPVREPFTGLQPSFDLYLGLARVEGSDGAVMGRAGVRYGWFGLELANTSYYEHRPTPTNQDDQIRMHVGSLSAQVRFLTFDRSAVWLVGGIATARSGEFAGVVGPAFGLKLEHPVNRHLSVEGSLRHFVLDRDLTATEARGAVRASILSLGYRRFAFNVGPPLQGPEVGLAFSF